MRFRFLSLLAPLLILSAVLAACGDSTPTESPTQVAATPTAKPTVRQATAAVVTAVVLGGTSVFGGRGTAVGVFVAACLLMIIQNAMNHLQISAYWQYVLTGGLTLLAVAIYASRGGNIWRRLLPSKE